MRSSLHRSDPGRLVETRRRGALAAAILALLSVAAPAPFDPRVVRASAADQKIVQAFHDYQFGEASLAQGNLRRASRYFGKALDLFPPFPEAHLGKGRIALAERRFEDALHEFEAARDSYSAAGGSLYDLRLVRYTDARKKAAEVRQLLTGIQSKLSFAGASNGTNQNDPGLHDHMIGSLAVRSFATETGRQMNLLEEQLAQQEAIGPPQPNGLSEVPGEVYFFMGNAQFNLGRLQEATDAWTTCTVKSALFPYAYDNLAVAWWKLGDFTEAIAVLEHARSLGVEINASLLSALRAAAGDSPAKTHP